MQQHSGEHIISGMLCREFNCNNVGFHMGSEIIQIDYDADMTREQVLEIEERANEYISENHDFCESWPSKEELTKLEYRSKKELSGAVRITEWPGADRCACCGTHVASSSEVGLLKVISVQKMKAGVRIELVCGRRALHYLSNVWEQNLQVSQLLSAKPVETAAAVLKLKEENFRLKGNVNDLEFKVFESIAADYQGTIDPVIILGDITNEGVRKLCDMVADVAEGRCCVFAGEGDSYKYAVIHRTNDIKDFIREMNTALNGRGGGKNGFAQGNLTAGKDEIKRFFEKRIC